MCFSFFKKLPTPVAPAPAPVPLVSLQDFPTYVDLEAWVTLHDELRMDSGNWCDDYSRESQRLAEADGYFLSTCLVFDGHVWGIEVHPRNPDKPDEPIEHIANSAIVVDTEEIYYVDLAFARLIKLTSFLAGGKY